MGQDYSYTQPSSSDEYDLTSLLEAEAALYAEEAESSYNIGEPVQCPPQPFQYLCGGHTNAEEMRAFETQLSLLKDQVRESDQKLAKLEKTLCDELCKKTSWVTVLGVSFLLSLLLLIAVIILGGTASKESRRVSDVETVFKDIKRSHTGTCLLSVLLVENLLDLIGAVVSETYCIVNVPLNLIHLNKFGSVANHLSLLGPKLLDRLLAKKVPLTEMETSLKLKLMSEMFRSKRGSKSRVPLEW
ncbi:hypothetical protein IGI04_011818 [Brassica rapa subsp. trilocularis]|uniref:Uncharacterized protein n=1 Tax=Brassica rapa subsp. trilocularis TaxID=1813537 RepID=A0ABQ7N471_BRACM|nr:hypothetical protein IGI04_011818 [Brassica rapa subsp. trilocularis]